METVERLPPTASGLDDGDAVPYFLFWTDVTVIRFRELLSAPDPEVRAYWLGALLREANTRDVWLFTSPSELRALWPRIIRHLGKSRLMWAYLLDLEAPLWPPAEARRAV